MLLREASIPDRRGTPHSRYMGVRAVSAVFGLLMLAALVDSRFNIWPAALSNSVPTNREKSRILLQLTTEVVQNSNRAGQQSQYLAHPHQRADNVRQQEWRQQPPRPHDVRQEWPFISHEDQQQHGQTQRNASSNQLAALRTCWTFDCLRWAQHQPRWDAGPYSFPHFLILGRPKTATTSLFWYLAEHPRVIPPASKEPEFFTKSCHKHPDRCTPAKQGHYLREALHLDAVVASNLSLAAFEASTHHAALGPELARPLAAQLPWLRLVASLREPISRQLSMLAHNLHKRRADPSCRRKPYPCLLQSGYLGGRNYSYPLSHWLAAFPAEQLLVIQYEELVAPETQGAVLQQLQAFLGQGTELSPQQDPSGSPGLPPKEAQDQDTAPAPVLGLYNHKKDFYNRDGWPMTRQEYTSLVERVRPDALRASQLLEKHGLVGSAAAWLASWEQVWQDNLEGCNEQGDCRIRLT